MTNELQVFNNEQFGQVRTMLKDGEPWFVAADVCKALEIKNGREATSRLDDDEKADVSLTDTSSNGVVQRRMFSIVNEPGLYALVLGSRKPEAKAFKRWITHEVIPAIRKTGGYIVGEADMSEDELITRAYDVVYRKLELMKQRVAIQDQKIAELEPKASYCDTILQCANAVTVTQIAKDYGMSAVTFNRKLAELGVQFKQGKTWIVYQKYADKGYTQSQTHYIGENSCVLYTCWTQKGRMFLYDLLKINGVLPLIEQEQAI